MSKHQRIPATDEAWDDRLLGADAEFAVRVDDNTSSTAVDEALGLRPISIRLHTALIEDFKAIAQLNGLGYQTLMRQVLKRFADCEKKRILQDAAREAEEAMQQEAEKVEAPKSRKAA